MLYFACWLQQRCKAGALSWPNFLSVEILLREVNPMRASRWFFLGPRALGPFSGSQEKSLYKNLCGPQPVLAEKFSFLCTVAIGLFRGFPFFDVLVFRLPCPLLVMFTWKDLGPERLVACNLRRVELKKKSGLRFACHWGPQWKPWTFECFEFVLESGCLKICKHAFQFFDVNCEAILPCFYSDWPGAFESKERENICIHKHESIFSMNAHLFWFRQFDFKTHVS